jgi:effector-binding domain-containing protein
MQINTVFLFMSLFITIFFIGAGTSIGEGSKVSSDIRENIIVKEIPDILVAGIRMKGKYSEMGKGFKKLGWSVGRYINGKSLVLYYDQIRKETAADYEPCFPIKKKVNVDGITCRTIKGGKAITLIHRGSYDTIKDAYAKIHEYRRRHDLKIRVPTREVYLKGPGRFFRGNPKKYITEIQFIIESDYDAEPDT